MLILVVKTLHVLGAMLFLGTGLGSAFYKFRAGRSNDARVIAWCDDEIVRADWLFTVPSGVIMPTTGLYLAWLYHLPWTTPWVLQGILGYSIAGVFWLPAAVLQIRMKRLSRRAADEGTSVPAAYGRMQRAWALLGVPSFFAAMWTVWLMVSKQALHWP